MMNEFTSHCPARHQFIFQAIGAETIEEARRTIHRVFGPVYGENCRLVRGVYRFFDWNRNRKKLQFVPAGGYMAFLPQDLVGKIGPNAV